MCFLIIILKSYPLRFSQNVYVMFKKYYTILMGECSVRFDWEIVNDDCNGIL